MDIKRQPVVIVFSTLAGLQVLTAGLGLIDVFNKDTVAIIVLVVAAVQAAATTYVRGMVTPWVDVVSKIASNGQVVAGPAAGPGLPPEPTTPPAPPEAPRG